jgi:hypothetical protein
MPIGFGKAKEIRKDPNADLVKGRTLTETSRGPLVTLMPPERPLLIPQTRGIQKRPLSRLLNLQRMWLILGLQATSKSQPATAVCLKSLKLTLVNPLSSGQEMNCLLSRELEI